MIILIFSHLPQGVGCEFGNSSNFLLQEGAKCYSMMKESQNTHFFGFNPISYLNSFMAKAISTAAVYPVEIDILLPQLLYTAAVYYHSCCAQQLCTQWRLACYYHSSCAQQLCSHCKLRGFCPLPQQLHVYVFRS